MPIDLEDMGIGAKGEILKQQPFAVVLGCADARVPIEVIFERACNSPSRKKLDDSIAA